VESKLHDETKALSCSFCAYGAQKEQVNGGDMRFTRKGQKDRGRPRAPRIAFSQDEITADLNYRGGEPRPAGSVAPSAFTPARRG
jgi:hypothetical protein